MEPQKKIIGSLLLLSIAVSLQAQDTSKLKIWEERKGCFRAQGNLTASYLFQQKQVGAYVTGDCDLFFDNRVSFNGQVWVSFATTRKNEPGVRANHAVFWGINFHPIKKGRFDPYIGLTNGIGAARVNYREGGELKNSPFAPVGLLSAQAGMNYYVGWIFHFFVKVQGVSGMFFSGVPNTVRLEEIKVTAGLGWNFRLWKPRHRGDSPLPMIDRKPKG